MLNEKACGRLPSQECRLIQNMSQTGLVCLQAQKRGICQRAPQATNRHIARTAVGDDLGQQGVIVGGDRVACPDAVVDADAFARRWSPEQHRPGGGQELVGRVFGIESRLDGMAAKYDVFLRPGQWLPTGQANLPLDDIDAGHQFRHRVLHLQAGVHLQETELAVGPQKLHRPRADIVNGLGQSDGRRAHRRSQFRRHGGRGRLLDNLLVAALDGALALAQMDDAAALVGQHLYFNVARMGQGALQQQVSGAEGGRRLASCRGQCLRQRARLVDEAHPLAAAARRRLDHHRIAQRFGRGNEGCVALVAAVEAGQHGHTEALGQRAGSTLVAHRGDGLGRWADEGQPGVGAGTGEIGVLGQKAVAGMDGVRSGALGGVKDGGDVEIGAGRRGRAKTHGGIGLFHVSAAGVGVGIDSHGAQAQLVAGADDAAGDLAAVGDEDCVIAAGTQFDFPALREGRLRQ